MCENELSVEIAKKIKDHKKNVSCMTKNKLIEALKLRKLDIEGVKSVLESRLLRHDIKLLKDPNKEHPDKIFPTSNFREKGILNKNIENSIRFYIVIDYEATCCKFQRQSFKHEIIEFPAILIDAEKRVIVKEFHSFVKPVLNAKLTDFCTELTGIDQKTVDDAPIFEEAFVLFEKWLCGSHCSKKNTVIVTDGNWDMGKFMYQQLKLCKMAAPWWTRQWMDIRKVFKKFYSCKYVNLASMLKHIEMTFEGRQHSGLDDSRNIARILIKLMNDGCEKLSANQTMSPLKLQKIAEINAEYLREKEEKEKDAKK